MKTIKLLLVLFFITGTCYAAGPVGGGGGTGVGMFTSLTVGTTGTITEETNTMTLDDGDGLPITLQDIRTATSGGDAAAIHDDTGGEIVVITEKTSPVDNDEALIEDSAASNAKKSLKLGNLWTNLYKGKADLLYQAPPTEGAFEDGDKTKLDAIEALADVTDATNVAAAGALMDSGTDNIDDTHINWGTGAGQVSMDDIGDGSTNAAPTIAQESNWDTAYGWGDHASAGYQAGNAYLTDIAGITANQGDIIYFDGTDWVDLGPGVNGQFLKTQGAAANPTWDDPAGSGDITAVGDSESGNAFTADGTGNNLYFEGTTPNTYEILVTGANPGADVTVTIPAETGSVVLGPAGFGTDNLLTKTNGTGNLTQATGIAVDDSNNMSNIGTIGSGAVTSSGAVTGSTVTDGTVTLAGDGTITGISEGGLPNSVVVSADIKNGEVASEDLAATLDLSGKTVTFGLETTDIPDLSGTYEAVDAEIARMDTADTVSADWEWQDGIAQSFGNDNDWEVAYDEAGDDRLEFSSNSAGTTSVAILNAGAGVANLVVDGAVNEGGTDLASKYQGIHAYLTDISNISGPSVGDLMYFDGTDWTVFEPGTNGYFIQSQGDGVALTWASGSSTGVNETYGSGWNADQGAPEKDDVYDYLHQFDADDDGSFADETWLANYMAAPGAIGGTTPAAITGTTITGTTFVIAGTADGGQYVSMLEDTDNGTNYSGWGIYGDLAASALYAPPLAASAGGQAMVFAAPGNQTMSDGTTKSVSVGTWVTPLTAETNSLETTCTGIADTEIPIGTSADTATYAALSGDVTMANTGAVTIANDAVTMAKIDDDGNFTDLTGNWTTTGTLTGGTVTDGTVTLAGNGTITGLSAGGLPDNSIDNGCMADDAVDSAEIASGAVDLDHMSANSVDSDQYVDGSIDAVHLSTMNAYANIPIAWMVDGTSAPDALDSTTRKPYAYRTFASDADEDLNMIWFVPSDLSGSAIQFRVKYLVTNATGPSSEGVAFGLSGVSLGDNDATNGAKGTVVVITDPTITAAQHDVLITGWSGDVTITNLAAGEVAELALIRDVSDAADDYGQVVGVISVELRYTKDPA